MAKPADLTPKFNLKTAERELELPLGTIEMGQRIGGVQMYSNVFKRGYGDAVFGSDENGIWLGAADYIDAPFRVAMDGSILSRSIEGNGQILIDGANVRITMVDDDGDTRGLWGDDGN